MAVFNLGFSPMVSQDHTYANIELQVFYKGGLSKQINM